MCQVHEKARAWQDSCTHTLLATCPHSGTARSCVTTAQAHNTWHNNTWHDNVNKLVVQHVDIQCAYLNGDLEEEIYVEQPPFFNDGTDC